jgi:hypothetical protein
MRRWPRHSHVFAVLLAKAGAASAVTARELGRVCQLVRKLWLREGGMRTSTHRRLWRSAVPRSYLGMGMCIPSSSADSMVRVARGRSDDMRRMGLPGKSTSTTQSTWARDVPR